MTQGARIAILGGGALTSIGTSRAAFGRALVQGRGGIAPVSSFDTSGLRCHLGGEIHDFDPHAHLEGKSLRGMSRSAHLACSAAALALGDGAPRPEDPSRTALVAGTAYGNVHSMVRFDRESFQEGPRFVDATLFPNTVINSPAGFTSIFFRLSGPNTTLSDGAAASLAAFDYAAALLLRGAADEVLAGGFEELSSWVYLGLHNAGRLAGSRAGEAEIGVPFDARRTGIVAGEGAGWLRLALPERCAALGAAPLAWITGQGEAFAPGPLGSLAEVDARATRAAMVQAMRAALFAARLESRDIDVVWASASGSPLLDALEAEALVEVFGGRAAELPIAVVKSALGECFGASGALQALGALVTLQDGLVPPTLGFESGDADPALGGVRAAPQRVEARHVLLNAFPGRGTNRSLVLARG